MTQFLAPFVEKRRPYLAALLIFLLSGLSLIIFLHQVPPERVADFLFAQSYLPFLLLIWLTVSSLASWLWAHLRLGILSGFGLSLWLFLTLQSLHLNWVLALFICLWLLIIEGFARLSERLLIARWLEEGRSSRSSTRRASPVKRARSRLT